MNTRSPKRLRSSTLPVNQSEERPRKRHQPEDDSNRAETSNGSSLMVPPLADTELNGPAPEPPINLRRSKRNATRGSTLQAPPFEATTAKLPITPISPLADDPFKVPNKPVLKLPEDPVVSTRDTPSSSQAPNKNRDSNLPSLPEAKPHNSNDQSNEGPSIYSHTKLPHALAIPVIPVIRVTAPSSVIQEPQAKESSAIDSTSLSDGKPPSQSHLSSTDGKFIPTISLGLPTPDEETPDLDAVQLPLDAPVLSSSDPCPVQPVLDADHISNPVESSSIESTAAINDIAAILGGAEDIFGPVSSSESSLGTKESFDTISSVDQSEEDVQLNLSTQVYYQSLLETFFPNECRFLHAISSCLYLSYDVPNSVAQNLLGTSPLLSEPPEAHVQTQITRPLSS